MIVLLHFLAYMPDIPLLFGPVDGIFPAEFNRLFADFWMPTRERLFHLSGLSLTAFNTAFNSAYILLSVCIMAGFFTRISALLLLLLNTALIKSGLFFAYGVDYFTSMALSYLILFPEVHHASLSSILFKRGQTQPTNYLIYRRFLQLHLSLAYFFSGLGKIDGFNWRNGEAVWKAINLPYSNLDFGLNISWLAEVPWLLVLLGWGVVLIELCYPLIFIKILRKPWLFMTIAMHAGIALVLNLYFFSAMMIAWNLTAFFTFPPPPASQNPQS